MSTKRDSIYDSLPILNSWYKDPSSTSLLPAAPLKTKPPCKNNNKRVSFRVEPSIISAGSYSSLVNDTMSSDYDIVTPSFCCHFKLRTKNRKSRASFQKLDYNKKMK